jgi:uncharacterized protein (DUF1800 family)
MRLKRMLKTITIGTFLTVIFAFTTTSHFDSYTSIRLPYKKAGLTTQQAAAHLLNRFSFGAKPGEVDAVVAQGVENWLEAQLKGKEADDELNTHLQTMDALLLSNETIANTYLTPGQIFRLAIKHKLIDKDSAKSLERKEYRAQLKEIMDQEGLKPFQELQTQLINQKILRAVYSNNQLHEVLTDFWFNHFNVSLTKPQCQQFILPYERDAIRPFVTDDFKQMVLATAKHPAMLEYLDNASSVSENNSLSQSPARADLQKRFEKTLNNRLADTNKQGNAFLKQAVAAKKTQGLNENYAREVMELHTLGVDGGYTQTDVTAVAKALTGWAVMPLLNDAPGRKLIEKIGKDNMEKRGFVYQGDFMFRADKHDESAKQILGKNFAENGGYYEGMKVLEMLSSHPSTAKFICKKLAIRFVNDHPSDALIQEMAASFLKHNGNIKEVLLTMVNNIEFWKEDALREKIKSPFELAISAIRATNATINQPLQIFNWCTKMGQRFYFYQAPTGFPDKGDYWINTGALLNRMNFGLAFATGKIPGVTVNLLALNENHEPESIEDALRIYSHLLLPERNQSENIKRLSALVRDENMANKIADATSKLPQPELVTETDMMQSMPSLKRNPNAGMRKQNQAMAVNIGNNSTVSQVTGVIIGSPEFQRK